MDIQEVQTIKTIEDVQIGQAFEWDRIIWIKTNASHDNAGFQCVELSRGNLIYLKKGTHIVMVRAEVHLFI